MIPRSISGHALDNARWFPIVSVTGPRQSGKSTLIRSLFGSYEYLNLEDERIFGLARESPADFIHERPDHLVIDEAQRLPALFNAIQVASDQRGTPGQYVLSGSQNFLLLRRVTQTLAGRVGLLRLLPLSYREALLADATLSPDAFMLKGGYPRLYDVSIPPQAYYPNYVTTYVERDVTGYIDARNVSVFHDFLRLCAQMVGSLTNLSRLATDLGVARATIESWLSILEASYVVLRLEPYHANLRKRLTKTPKLYFYDTGLLCYLLGIETDAQLRDSGMRGAIFENLIIAELLKRHWNNGRQAHLSFYRDDSKVEVDLIDQSVPSAMELIEIKSSQTYQSRYLRHLNSVGDELGVPCARRHLVMRSPETGVVLGVKVWSAQDWLLREDDVR